MASTVSSDFETIVAAIDERDQVLWRGIERGFDCSVRLRNDRRSDRRKGSGPAKRDRTWLRPFRPTSNRSSRRSTKGIGFCEEGSNVASTVSSDFETIVAAIDERDRVLRRGIERGLDRFVRLRNDRRGDRRKGTGPAKGDRTWLRGVRPAPKRSSRRSTKGNRSCEGGSNVASGGRPAPKRSLGRSTKGIGFRNEHERGSERFVGDRCS